MLLGHDKIADILIQNGANVHAADNDGETPLSLATHKGKICKVKKFSKLFKCKLMPLFRSRKSCWHFNSKWGKCQC